MVAIRPVPHHLGHFRLVVQLPPECSLQNLADLAGRSRSTSSRTARWSPLAA